MTDREMKKEVAATLAHLAVLINEQIVEGNFRALYATCMSTFHALSLAGIDIDGAVKLFKEAETDSDLGNKAVEVYPENIKEVLS